MKGSTLDMFFIIGAVFLLAIGFFIAFAIGENIDLSEYGMNQTYVDNAQELLSIGDLLIITVFIFLVIGAIIYASQTYTHPSFIIISLILLAILVLFAVIFSNVFEEFAGQDELANATTEYNITTTLFSNLPLIVFVLSIVTIVIIYSKTKNLVGV